MYGSILMAVTFSPVIFNRSPVDEANARVSNSGLRRYAYGHKPITPFPIPLTTPPETMMYLVMTIETVGQGRVVSGKRSTQQRKTRRDIKTKKIGFFFLQ
jgi:hypothetical protein